MIFDLPTISVFAENARIKWDRERINLFTLIDFTSFLSFSCDGFFQEVRIDFGLQIFFHHRHSEMELIEMDIILMPTQCVFDVACSERHLFGYFIEFSNNNFFFLWKVECHYFSIFIRENTVRSYYLVLKREKKVNENLLPFQPVYSNGKKGPTWCSNRILVFRVASSLYLHEIN